MKDQMLKLAGVKTEKEFYKLFPTEEAFMAKYGKQVKKLQMKQGIQKAQTGAQFPLQEPNPYVSAIEAPVNELSTGAVGAIGTRQNYIPMQPMQSKGMPAMQANPMDAFVTAPQDKTNIDWANGVPLVGGIAKGISQLRQEKSDLEYANQWKDVSDVALKASKSRDVDFNRMNKQMKWDPSKDITSGNEFFPTKGVGTNVLGKNGVKVPKAAWGQLLQGLGGAKPLSGTGKFAQEANQFIDAGGANTIQQGLQSMTGDTGGGTIGGEVGGAIGSIWGPVGQAVGKLAGTGIGALADSRVRKKEKAQSAFANNINKMAFQVPQNQYMEQGGDINPQLVSSVQGMTADDYARFAHQMRTGGNIKQNNIEDLQLYEGGTEQVSPDMIKFQGPSHADGGQDIAYGGNPVEVEGGEYASEMPDGQTGEDNLVVFGNLTNPLTKRKFKYDAGLLAKAEAKQTKLADKSVEKIGTMNVRTPFDKLAFTSLKLNTIGANMKLKVLEDEKNNLAAMQSAINDTAEEYSLDADNLAKGTIKHAKYGDVISKAQNGDVIYSDANKQKAYEDFLNRSIMYKTDSDVARRQFESVYNNQKAVGKQKWENHKKEIYEKYLKDHNFAKPNYFIPSGNEGPDVLPYDKWNKEIYKYGIEGAQSPEFKQWFNKKIGKATQPIVEQQKQEDIIPINTEQPSYTSKGVTGGKGKSKTPVKSTVVTPTVETSAPFQYTPLRGELPGQFDEHGNNLFFDYDKATGGPSSYPSAPKATTALQTTTTNSTLNPWITGINAMLPFIRPSDAEPLDPNQVAGEMYALSTNQLEPVQAQGYHPQLGTPYDISLQEIRNENQADFRSAQRLMPYNPAAQSMLAAQKYAANQKVGAEEFRMNQAEKDRIYEGNRGILNDAQLKNLGIYGDQANKQAQARSNTKDITQTALSSISNKYQQNKLENRTAGINENLYNYRFDNKGRAWNWNPLAQWNTTIGGKPTGQKVTGIPDDWTTLYDESGEFAGTKKKTKADKERNGAIVRAMKTNQID